MAADPLTSRTVDNFLEGAGFSSDDDPFADKPTRNIERDDKATLSPRKRKADDNDVFGREMDEEVKITKQRKKIPKLDAERLLSDPGLPKIRKSLQSGDFKKKLRLKGKGHEFSDAARLLNYYQLWLDQLYPRAKFADAIQLVEKVGHTKRLQIYRKSWIDEGKPGYVRREDVERAIDEQDAHHDASPRSPQDIIDDNRPEEEDPTSLFLGSGHNEPDEIDGPDDDELDALLAQGDEPTSHSRASRPDAGLAYEAEDDLDALLAQPQPQKTHSQSISRTEDQPGALFTAQKPHESSLQPSSHQTDVDGDDRPSQNSEDESDDLDALLAAHDVGPEPDLPSIPVLVDPATVKETRKDRNTVPSSGDAQELDNVVSSSPVPNVRTDELDQLMDEHDATVKQKHTDTEIVEQFMSSSPMPNGESQ